jgi:hypothetical protein
MQTTDNGRSSFLNVPTSSSCHALVQVKVIACALVSFCYGLDLIDPLGHPLTDEAENRINNKTCIFTDTLLHLCWLPCKSCVIFISVCMFTIHWHHTYSDQAPLQIVFCQRFLKYLVQKKLPVFHSAIMKHKLLKQTVHTDIFYPHTLYSNTNKAVHVMYLK